LVSFGFPEGFIRQESRLASSPPANTVEDQKGGDCA